MRISKKQNGYSEMIAKNYVNDAKPVYCLSAELIPQYEWVDSRPTTNIVGYSAWFTQEDLEPFKIKFGAKVKLPEYLTKVELQGLEACEVRNNVYFRASGIKEDK